ncbi:MAG: hypothetical protein M0R76_06265 [Proteobacteria bacterium]|nr:hypothetical protein [Pseudomonadota bacterium]
MKECENLVSSVNTVVSRIVTLRHDPEFRTALRDVATAQQTTFQWLREVTQDKDFYIERYMQTDDSALPENAGDLAARIRELKSQLQERQQQQRTIRKLMDKIGLHPEVVVYQEYHALLVEHAKQHYSKKPFGVGDPLINIVKTLK